jgi:predicted esterase
VSRKEFGAITTALTVPYLLELPEGDPPAAGWPLVVALHGMGMRAERFADQVRGALPAGTALAVPTAPLPFEQTNQAGERVIRRAWYVYAGDSPEFRRELRRTAGMVSQLRTAILAGRPLDPGRVVVLGFSQGGYLAGVAGLQDRARYQGLAVCAARLKVEMLEAELRDAAGFPVLLVRATEDRAMPAEGTERGRAALAAAGAAVSVREVPGRHVFSAAMAGAVREWLEDLWG